jgi:hypothetical protein
LLVFEKLIKAQINKYIYIYSHHIIVQDRAASSSWQHRLVLSKRRCHHLLSVAAISPVSSNQTVSSGHWALTLYTPMATHSASSPRDRVNNVLKNYLTISYSTTNYYYEVTRDQHVSSISTSASSFDKVYT